MEFISSSKSKKTSTRTHSRMETVQSTADSIGSAGENTFYNDISDVDPTEQDAFDLSATSGVQSDHRPSREGLDTRPLMKFVEEHIKSVDDQGLQYAGALEVEHQKIRSGSQIMDDKFLQRAEHLSERAREAVQGTQDDADANELGASTGTGVIKENFSDLSNPTGFIREGLDAQAREQLEKFIKEHIKRVEESDDQEYAGTLERPYESIRNGAHRISEEIKQKADNLAEQAKEVYRGDQDESAFVGITRIQQRAAAGASVIQENLSELGNPTGFIIQQYHSVVERLNDFAGHASELDWGTWALLGGVTVGTLAFLATMQRLGHRV